MDLGVQRRPRRPASAPRRPAARARRQPRPRSARRAVSPTTRRFRRGADGEDDAEALPMRRPYLFERDYRLVVQKKRAISMGQTTRIELTRAFRDVCRCHEQVRAYAALAAARDQFARIPQTARKREMAVVAGDVEASCCVGERTLRRMMSQRPRQALPAAKIILSARIQHIAHRAASLVRGMQTRAALQDALSARPFAAAQAGAALQDALDALAGAYASTEIPTELARLRRELARWYAAELAALRVAVGDGDVERCEAPARRVVWLYDAARSWPETFESPAAVAEAADSLRREAAASALLDLRAALCAGDLPLARGLAAAARAAAVSLFPAAPLPLVDVRAGLVDAACAAADGGQLRAAAWALEFAGEPSAAVRLGLARRARRLRRGSEFGALSPSSPRSAEAESSDEDREQADDGDLSSLSSLSSGWSAIMRPDPPPDPVPQDQDQDPVPQLGGRQTLRVVWQSPDDAVCDLSVTARTTVAQARAAVEATGRVQGWFSFGLDLDVPAADEAQMRVVDAVDRVSGCLVLRPQRYRGLYVVEPQPLRLGHSARGEARRALRKSSAGKQHTPVTLVRFARGAEDEAAWATLAKLRELGGERAVRLLDYHPADARDPDCHALVLEAVGATVGELLVGLAAMDPALRFGEQRALARELVAVVAWLHARGVVAVDVSLDAVRNVGDDALFLKLADVSFAVFMDRGARVRAPLELPLRRCPREVALHRLGLAGGSACVSAAGDVYALALAVFEVLNWPQGPLLGASDEAAAERYRAGADVVALVDGTALQRQEPGAALLVQGLLAGALSLRSAAAAPTLAPAEAASLTARQVLAEPPHVALERLQGLCSAPDFPDFPGGVGGSGSGSGLDADAPLAKVHSAMGAFVAACVSACGGDGDGDAEDGDWGEAEWTHWGEEWFAAFDCAYGAEGGAARAVEAVSRCMAEAY